ncbi:MAG: OadG family protein, partial [Treponema sp.]|jgi:oxaloacetate decarboxylase gamma subunit|nr:OadG family protein [Treponema sp.]
MGIVFSFLVILIIAVTLSGKVIRALHWDKDVQQPAKAPAAAGPALAGGNQGAVTAAISAAVTEYRKSQP